MKQTIVTFLIAIIICALADIATPQVTASARLAQLDRSVHVPRDAWPFTYYIDLEPWVGDERRDLLAALRLMICSTSKEQVVENIIPAVVDGAPNLLRIDIRALQWQFEDWKGVLANHPYESSRLPLVVRGDWLLLQLADEKESDAYLTLLFGGKNRPKTRDQALQLLGVSNDRRLVFGLIEGQSGVAKQGTRWIENRPILRGYAWGTRDSLKLNFEKDPLEHPDGSHIHDGEEWIIGLPKMSSTTGIRGTLQAYFLANGQGNVVDFAPVDLVEDSTTFRGYREIRSPGSCVQCHKQGLNDTTTNEIRRLSQAGVLQFTSDDVKARELQAFHLGEVKKDIDRNNEDYQTIVEHITGMPSTQVAEAFRRAINRYDAPLDLSMASQEFVRHGITAETATAALQAASTAGTSGARISSLARGQKIPRVAWEQQFLQTAAYISQWSKTQ